MSQSPTTEMAINNTQTLSLVERPFEILLNKLCFLYQLRLIGFKVYKYYIKIQYIKLKKKRKEIQCPTSNRAA